MRNRGIAFVAALLAGASLGTAGCGLAAADEEDQLAERGLRLDPRNPHYLVFRGKPTVLITSAEHYGAVVNADFDFVRYLDELKRYGFNHTRVFSGTFIEPGAPAESLPPSTILGYDNTLAPRAGRFVSPWARDPQGSGSGARFDLGRWNPAYFKRLKRFMTEASKRGVVVELVLFGALYGNERWEASPFNARNNVNGVGAIEPRQLHTLTNGRLLDFQEALVRKLVRELRSFDNVYYEVMNEPWIGPAPASDQWQDHMIQTIERAESRLPQRHLIARNYEHNRGPIRDPHPSVSIFNFHYERDPGPYLNLEGVISFDETGGEGTEDAPYRIDGWLFMLSGGGVYSNLDWSFTPDREDGGAELPPAAPGGGGPSLRRSLAVLKSFLERFDLPGMVPAGEIVTSAPDEASVRVLADHGRSYAVYLLGGALQPLTLDIAAGTYRVEWIDTQDGAVRRRQRLDHFGGPTVLSPPPYEEDIALAIEAE